MEETVENVNVLNVLRPINVFEKRAVD